MQTRRLDIPDGRLGSPGKHPHGVTNPIYGCLPSDVVATTDLEPVLSLNTRIMARYWVVPYAGVGHGVVVCVEAVVGEPESSP